MELKGAYHANYISRYILASSRNIGIRATNLRLQKLLYFVEGFYMLGNNGTESCFKEQILAWTYGPVVHEVYDTFKVFGNQPIEHFDQIFGIDTSKGTIRFTNTPWDSSVIKPETKEMIDNVNKILRRYPDFALVDMTHDKRGPWARHYGNPISEVIPKVEIYDYFRMIQNG